MYTNDPLQKKLWSKTVGGSDVGPSSVHLTPLRKTDRVAAAHASSARSTGSLPHSPLPVRSLASGPDFEDTNGQARGTTTTVMDPLAALRQCLQYVCSHPEVYGDDVRGLLDREVMHVVRLKASEVSLIHGQRPLVVEPLDSTSVRQPARSFTSPGALPSISATHAASSGGAAVGAAAANTTSSSSADRLVPVGDLFGYGSVSFLPANSAGFNALMRESRAQTMTSRVHMLSSPEEPNNPAALPLMTGPQPLDEPIQWNGTLPPSSTSPAAGKGIAADVGRDSAAAAAVSQDIFAGGSMTATDRAFLRGDSTSKQASMALSSPEFSLADPYAEARRQEDARLFRQVDELSQSSHLASSRSVLGGPVATIGGGGGGAGVVLDHHGYEVTYLRTQLQQLEAAFNAKCVRLHELESENKLFAAQMKTSEEAAARWSADHHAMEGKLEALRRELDGWKDRANDALAAATKQNKQRSQHAKQLASNQINDAKQEAARLSQLWRETERALQESRRAFENTEKEAAVAHNHLDDAFHYLERLERRVARRDAYVQLCERRQRSLEEKYEKLMWGYEELSVLEGRYSYVDYLLTSRPLWSVYLFVALVEHRGDFAAVEDQGELRRRLLVMTAPFQEETEPAPGVKPAAKPVTDGGAAVAAAEGQSWLLFARTPHGSRYAGSFFDPSLVVRTMVEEVTAEIARRGRAKQLRTSLHGSVACRVVRWGERYSIDYLGGQDSFPDGGDLNRKFVPVLTVASLLLPLRSRSGAFMQAAATAAGASPAASSEPSTGGAAKVSAATLTALTAPIANTRAYDVATIRFVLRCFWKERLAAFVRQMRIRVEAVAAKQERLRLQRQQRQQAAHARKKRNSASTSFVVPVAKEGDGVGVDGTGARTSQDSHGSNDDTVAAVPPAKATDGVEAEVDDEDVDEEEEEADDEELTENAPAIATFLSALVDFATRFAKLPAGSAADANGVAFLPGVANPGVMDDASSLSKSTLLRVRGVLARGFSAKTGGHTSSASKSASNASPAFVSAEATLWDSGRVFFAAVLQPNASKGSAPAASVVGNTDTVKSAASDGSSDSEVASLAEEVRELLAALYYYTMEFKSSDPDFRLFYLVSHQLIPEMVAVNFFASLESLQRDGAALLEKRIRRLAGDEGVSSDADDEARVAEDDATEVSSTAEVVSAFGFAMPSVATAAAAAEADDPLSALARTVQIIDEAPLDGQDDEIEPDSDGEGYGSIIPFHAKANVHDGAAVTLPSPKHDARGDDKGGSVSGAGQSRSRSLARKESSVTSRTLQRAKELKLLHNIRAYLRARRPSTQDTMKGRKGDTMHADAASPLGDDGAAADDDENGDDDTASMSSAMASPSHTVAKLSSFAFGEAPQGWSQLEEAVLQSLAPHTALLDAFRSRCGPKGGNTSNIMAELAAASMTSMASKSTLSVKEDRGYLRRKRDDRKTRHELTKHLSATRGLLPLDDVLALLQRHCFATYAVSCCGTPRFSLTDALMKGNAAGTRRVSDNPGAAADAMQPYVVVGHLPPTGLHLQRLRFALSLDQPSHLVDISRLFTVDAITKANSQLYNTYLTLTLDLFQQQQSFLMQCVLKTCAARHEKYAAEGAEDCDGQIPIAALRKGMTKALSSVQGSAQHATALVNHLVQYDELLRLEDEVKLEQFADAPMLLNIPAGPPRTTSAMMLLGTGSNAARPTFVNNASSSNINNASTSGHRSAAASTPSPFHHRKSDTASIMEEVEDAEFNLREEAENCSLLHIAFAVRMTYIVWGRMCADTAAALVSRIVQRPVPVCRSQLEDGEAAGAGKDSTKVTEMPEWDVFERQLRQRYALRVDRLRDGHNGDDNPLRRTLRTEFAKAAGLPLTTLYGTAEQSNTAAGATSAAAAEGPSLYPDLSNVFEAASTSTCGVATTTLSDGGGGVPAPPAGKKKGSTASLATSSRSSIRPAPGPTSPSGNSVPPPLPDFGLISLARALGFATPVVAPSDDVAGGGAGASGGGKKNAGKKTGKKTTAKKAVAGDPGSLPPVVQEEYSRALSSQLQTLATRLSRLVARGETAASAHGAGSAAPSAATSPRSGAKTAVPPVASAPGSSPVTVTFSNADTEASTGAARATARTRSVAFVQESRGDDGAAENSAGKSAGGDGGSGGRPLAWRPVFAEEARTAETNTHDVQSASLLLNVSRLYAACAALSIL